jgi:hypothetical protein
MAEPEPNPFAPPASDTQSPPPAPPSSVASLTGPNITRGARIAGAFLIVNGVLVLGEKLAMPHAGSIGIAPLFDFLIGGTLVAGHGKYRSWAIVRAALGAVVFTAMQLAGGDYIAGAMQIAVSGALLALLLGDAGVARIVVSCVVFGLYAVISLLGLIFVTMFPSSQ